MTAAEAMSVAIDARVRHTGLPPDVVSHNRAGEPNAGDIHGRLCLMKCITKAQWDAAEYFMGVRSAYLRSIQAASDTRATGPAESSAADEDAYADWCRRQKARWSAIMECLSEASIANRSPIIDAFDKVLVRGYWLDHMIGDLRIGLNAIHRDFLSTARQAA